VLSLNKKEGDHLSRIALRSGTSWLAIFAGQGVICAGAMATPITVTDTINVSQALTAGGGTFSGTFDINSLLPTTGNYSSPLNILSATLAVYGYSSPASQQVVGAYSGYQQSYAGAYYFTYYYYVPGYTYYYSCGWFAYCEAGYSGYYQAATGSAAVVNEDAYNTLTNLDNTTDTQSTTVGADTLTSSDQRTVTNLGTTRTNTSNYYPGNGYTDYQYFNDTDTINDFISGDLSGSQALSAATLLLLGQGGTLGFSTAAAGGQFVVTQYDLTVTLDQSLAAPEPSTLSIFGFGLLLIALRARSVNRPPRHQ
jgi:hypothetical protein